MESNLPTKQTSIDQELPAKRVAKGRNVARVFLILPAYNEQESLGKLLKTIEQVSKSVAFLWEVIVVDDGSWDDTALIADGATKRMSLKLVKHEVNQGLAAALRTGLTVALRTVKEGDVIVTMDADNTHPPQLIRGMVVKIEDGYDIVIASRFQKGATIHGVPKLRRFYSLGARWLFQLFFPIRGVRDYTCSYRAYRAEVLQRGLSMYGECLITETGFSCMADLLLKLRQLGGVRMGEVPLELHYERRGTGSKMYVWWTIGQTLMLIIRRRFGRN